MRQTKVQKTFIYWGKKKAWNSVKRTKTPLIVTEGLAATDKGSFYNQQAWPEEYTHGEGLCYKREHSDSSDFFLMLKAVMANLIAIVIILKNL